jgi:hypothetical protein
MFHSPKAAQVQQLWWQCHLGERDAFFRGEELAREVIGLCGGIDRARDPLLFSFRR